MPNTKTDGWEDAPDGWETSAVWEDPKMGFMEGMGVGWTGFKNNADIIGSMAAHTLSRLGTPGGDESIFENLNQRIQQRTQEANPMGKKAGVIGTLGMGIGAAPGLALASASGVPVMKDFVDQGESLPRAYAAGAVETAGNTLFNWMIPNLGATRLGTMVSGATINPIQGGIQDLIEQAIAEKPETKKNYDPLDPQRRGLEAVMGGVYGGILGPRPAKQPPPKQVDTARIVAEHKLGADTGLGKGQLELFDQSSQGRVADPFGAHMGDWRVDENGIPIRADLSMEVQNMQNPLQRNLWGDELQPRVNPIGQAATLAESQRQFREQDVQGAPTMLDQIDATPPGIQNRAGGRFTEGTTRGNLIEPLQHDLPASGRLEGAKVEADTAPLGSSDPSLSPTPKWPKGQRGAVDPEVLKEGFRGVNRWLSRLTDQPWVRQSFPASAYETNADGSPRILLHGTRHGFEGTPKAHREGFHAGYGAPATMKAGERIKGHGNWRVGNIVFGNTVDDLPGGSAVYPIVVRKGYYPFLDSDFGTWSPLELSREGGRFVQKVTDVLTARDVGDQSSFTEKQSIYQKNYAKVNEMVRNFRAEALWVDGKPSLDGPDLAKLWGEYLKRDLGIDGFYYTNKYESPKKTLHDYGYGSFPENQAFTQLRMLKAARKLKDPDSFVTWNDNNIKSIYDERARYNPIPTGQRGGLNIEDISEAFSIVKNRIRGFRTTDPDNVQTPSSPTNIEARAQLRAKAKAINLTDSVYNRISTIEEVKANPGPDIHRNAVRDKVVPGVGGLTRHYPKNNVLKAIRDWAYDGRNLAESLSKKYVTGPNGLTTLYRKLSNDEQMRLSEAMQEVSRQQVPFDEALMTKLQFSEAQKAFARRWHEASDDMYRIANDALQKQGFEPFPYRKGYVPSMFSGAYLTILRNPKGGQVLIAQGDTKYIMNKAVEYYKQHFPDHTEIIKVPRRGLNEAPWKSNRVFDGFNQLISELAKHDPEFAKIKQLADQHGADSIRHLMNFQVHEKIKSGARGALGDRPWLNRQQNARQFFEGMVNYLEEGSRYYSYQDPLNKIGKLMTDPDLIKTHPNTLEFAQKYAQHLTGKDLDVFGAAGNKILDWGPKVLGISPRYLSEGLEAMRTGSSIVMMGGINVGFFGMQLTQAFTGGIPEAMKISGQFGVDAAPSLGTMMKSVLGLQLEVHGKKADFVPQHMRQAWEWAHDKGMFTFSEAMLAHEVFQNPALLTAKQAATFPMWAGELMTRPPVFMWFADIFHRAGFKGEDAFRRAQEATDYAMANYHPDERATIYSSLGGLGQMMGALTTYKHNIIDQYYTRVNDARGGEIVPALAMAGIVYSLWGLTGLPFYEDMDQFVKWATNRSIRDIGEGVISEPSVWDGYLSTQTQLDFQSRLSMSRALPQWNGPQGLLPVVSPHLANTINILGKAYDYGKNRDVQSRNEFLWAATPTGMRGMLEAGIRQDEQGNVLNKYGQRKFSENEIAPRSEAEWNWRIAAGIRPIRERLLEDKIYNAQYRKGKEEKDVSESYKNMLQAIMNDDAEGTQKWMKDYLDKGGDPRSLSNSTLRNQLIRKQQSELQRRQGKPSGNLNTLRKFEYFKDVVPKKDSDGWEDAPSKE